ncbi:hypothetical protein [Rubrivirga marina]|uniref:Outer membrane protein beta-barrel domain-containing protein n=1 Tax=Rubrivirga marina TaxID=1196024 RepID=A0A271J338_9BACT|nr:hypothetical protein [Rubrivirga marina]PAP77941.1 hypothetical protein BSZ37_16590 [Rubrivirga marina]
MRLLPPPFRAALAVFCLVLAAAPADAQYRGSASDPITAGRSASVTVGPLRFQSLFGHDGLDRPPVPEQERSGIAFRLAGESSTLTLGYVASESAAPGSTTTLGSAALVDLQVGPTIRAFTVGDESWVTPLVPIQFSFGYQYLQPPQPASETEEGPDAFHLGRFGIGVGLGLEAGTEIASSVASEIVGTLAFVVAPGTITDFSDIAFDPAFGQRTVRLDAEVRVAEVAETGLGVALGYTRQVTQWDPAGVESASDLADALSADGYVEQSRVGIFRIGITF